MPLKKGSNKNKRLAKKIGLIIITISIIGLIFFIFFAYSYLFKNKALEQKQEVNLIEEIDDYQLKVPEKIIKKIPIEEEMPEEKVEEKMPEKAIETEKALQEISTTSTTSIEVNIEDIITVTSTNETEQPIQATNTNEILAENNQIDITQIIDSDGDLLSDKEEIILGTDKDSNDSDEDGFDDLQEVLTLNNPIGEGIIEANENMAQYRNTELNYSLFYPSVWSYNKLNDNGSVKFQTIDNQNIQIIIPMNSDNLTIEEWYATEVSAKRIKQGQKINKNNWEGLKSENGLNAYIIHPSFKDRVFVIFYTPGIENVLDYKNIFDMMVNSFTIITNEKLSEVSEQTATTSTDVFGTSTPE